MAQKTPAPQKRSSTKVKKPVVPAQPEAVVTGCKSEPKPKFLVYGKRLARFVADSSIPEVLLIATLSMSRYLQNSDFSYPSEIILNIVLLGIIVSVFYYVYRVVLRSRLGAHVAGLLLAYSFYGFTSAFPTLRKLGNKLIPDGATSFTKALLLMFFLAIVFGLAGLAAKYVQRLKPLRTAPLLKFLLFVVVFIFAIEVGKVGMRMWEIRHDLAYKQPASSLQQYAPKTKTASASKPNVYYLLFDRYANGTTLKNIYNYDNSPLLNSLTSQGFYVRDDAYANYPFTMQSVSSTLSAGYHTQLGKEFKNDATGFQTGFPYRQALDHSPVTQAFQANGYSYNQVSSWWDFTRDNPSANTNPTKSFRLRIFGKNFWLTDLQRDIVNKSILSPLLLKGATIGKTTLVQYQLDRNPTQNFYAQMQSLKSIAAKSSTQTQPQFTFAHILSPHDPYIFDANGNTPTYDGNRTDQGVDETVKYTNQVTYLNTQIESLVKTIRAKDPKAAIVIQADEGPYPKQFRGTLSPGNYYDPVTLPTAQQRQKFGVLAAYYMPGADQQPVATTIDASANTFRFVLNNYLGYSLPTLPDCQFTAGDKYNLFSYSLVSGKLKNTNEPAACKPYL